jgi:hypothetical protein
MHRAILPLLMGILTVALSGCCTDGADRWDSPSIDSTSQESVSKDSGGWGVGLGGVLLRSITPWGGPAYDIDDDKIGTGEQAFILRNDPFYWNGEPQDLRSDR